MRRVSVACALGAVLALATIDAVQAQAIGYRGYGSSGFLDYSAGAGLRLLSIVLWSGAGLAVGWFFSPQARAVRLSLAALAGVLAVAVATLHGGSLGWSLSMGLSFIGFFAMLGYWLAKSFRELEPPRTFGSARWATVHLLEDNGLFGSTGFRLGRFRRGGDNRLIRYGGDRHLLTVAPTRSGKGTTAIIPNLLTYPGSALVIDPKGENAKVTAQARRDLGQDVHILDPWNMVKLPGFDPARFNPIDWLLSDPVAMPENAMILADAMVVTDGKGERFWTEEAKALLQGLILYVATDPNEEGQRHLPRMRELLLLSGDDLKSLFRRMLASPHHLVASTGARCLQKEEKLLANVIASAQAETHFLDSTSLQESLSASDVRFEDLKAKAITIYLVLPADRLHGFGRWLRLLVQQALTVNARNIEVQPERPILFLLDEMAALGRLAMVEQAYGLMAGFGMQLWGIIQDLSQLKTIYGEGWETFVGNAGVIQYFGSRDRMTAEYFSALCGETTVWTISSAISRAFTSANNGGSDTVTYSDSKSTAQRKLAYPDELMRLDDDKGLLFVQNLDPIVTRKEAWFRDPDLKALGRNLRA